MNRLFLLVVIGLGFARCKQPAVEAPPKFNYNQEATKIMAVLKPQLIGTWSFSRVQITARQYSNALYGAKLVADTTIQNFATVAIQQALVLRDTPDDPSQPQFAGAIQFKGKSYPIYIRTRANAERVVHGTGYLAVAYFEFNFPVGRLPDDPEYRFLDSVGLSDYYSLEIGTDGKTMLWKALNSGLSRIEMQKR